MRCFPQCRLLLVSAATGRVGAGGKEPVPGGPGRGRAPAPVPSAVFPVQGAQTRPGPGAAREGLGPCGDVRSGCRCGPGSYVFSLRFAWLFRGRL